MDIDTFLEKFDGAITPTNVKKFLDPESSVDAYELYEAATEFLNKANDCGIDDPDSPEVDEFLEASNKFEEMLAELGVN